MTDTPPLSVVVASAATPEALRQCLNALVPQALELGAEVIVADATGADLASSDDLSSVRTLPFPEGTSTPTLWGEGLARARGPVLAVIDATTLPGPGWARAAARATSDASPIVGGVVEPLPGASWADWTAYFCEYAQFMRPLPEGTARELPGNNVVFRRDLLAIGSAYTAPAFWKTYWCGELVAAGVPLTAAPDLVVTNAKSYRLGAFLRRRYRHGRCYGGMRNEGAPLRRRALWVVGAPAVPLLLFGRALRSVLPRRRFTGRLLLTLPALFASALWWGVGEGVGTLAGPGDTCKDLA